MKTSNKRKSILLAAAIVLALATVLSGTFAWFTASAQEKNRLATKDALANVKIQEVFVEPDDWKPGQTITKEVSAINVGSGAALVRVSFQEDLAVSLPPTAETTVFDAAKETAGKTPLLVDESLYPAADGWFEVTTTANAGKGGIKLAADYAPVKVFALYNNTTGSVGSYSFAVWAPITGTSFAGKAQDVNYSRAWDNTTKVLTLNDIQYMTYQGKLTAQADWTVAADRAITSSDTGKSIAEAKINASGAGAGKYPGYIKLNYDNITATPTAGKWYFNAADGYFYYVGKVEGGTVTPNMLKSLLLDKAADSDYYSNLTFILTVNLKALQNTKDAIAAEWSTVASNATLNTALEALCES